MARSQPVRLFLFKRLGGIIWLERKRDVCEKDRRVARPPQTRSALTTRSSADANFLTEVLTMEVVSSEVSIRTGAEQMPAHLARPASGGPWPALVVVMEAFGLNDQIKRITNQFASEGFVAISPNLYFRKLDNVVGYNDLPGAFRLMGSVKDDQIVADMGAAIDHLKLLKEVKPACRNPAVRATAPYSGGGMVKSRQPGVKPPIEYVDGLKGPVLAFFGGKDAFIPITEVDEFQIGRAS